MSGTFLSKVFDGPYKSVPKWIEIMEKYISEKGMTVKKHYSILHIASNMQKSTVIIAIVFTEVEGK
jgi:predicted thioesterase